MPLLFMPLLNIHRAEGKQLAFRRVCSGLRAQRIQGFHHAHVLYRCSSGVSSSRTTAKASVLVFRSGLIKLSIRSFLPFLPSFSPSMFATSLPSFLPSFSLSMFPTSLHSFLPSFSPSMFPISLPLFLPSILLPFIILSSILPFSCPSPRLVQALTFIICISFVLRCIHSFINSLASTHCSIYKIYQMNNNCIITATPLFLKYSYDQ